MVIIKEERRKWVETIPHSYMHILEITHGYYDTSLYKRLFEKFDSEINYSVAIPVDINFQGDDFVVNGANCYNIAGLQNRRFGLLANARRCADIISEKVDLKDVNLIHTHFMTDAVIAYFLNKRCRIPYITSLRSSCCKSFMLSKQAHRKIIGKLVLKKAKQIVFISPNARKSVLENTPHNFSRAIEEKSVVIPNGIDDFWHKNKYEEEREIDPDRPVRVLTVGAIIKRKNHIKVAEAIKSLNGDGHNIEYILIGNAQDESVFNELIKFDFVRYEGTKTKEQLIPAYRDSDIFALVSYDETFGLVYAEALSQGMPIIYTEGEGFDGQVENEKVGCHVDPSDIVNVKKAILFVLEKYKMLSKSCVEASNKFDWLLSAQQYIEIYKHVIENPGLD